MRLLTLTFFITLAAALTAAGQTPCITAEESAKVIASMGSDRKLENGKKIRKELVERVEQRNELRNKITLDMAKKADLIPKTLEMARNDIARVCRLYVEFGFLTKSDIGDEGFEAMLLIISDAPDGSAQRSLLPILNEAARRKLLEKSFLASVVDGIRISFGAPQLFGTKARIYNDVVYVYPLLNDDKVDDWRAEYGLSPFADQLRKWHLIYLLPVVRAPRRSLPKAKSAIDPDTSLLGISDDSEKALVVDTRLVNLNIRLLTPDTAQDAGLGLTKDDFVVEENGVKQDVSFFSDTGTPFDIVLLLDFSASTEGKQDLIKKSAKRFVDVVRPDDRVAVVSFANQISLMADFSDDKTLVKSKIDKIKEFGASPIWDSVRFAYETLLDKKTPGRRTAIVLMSDADDTSSRTNFADLIEFARRGETTIFPMLVPGESNGSRFSERVRKGATMSAELLAKETGGQVFKAQDFKDLDRVYESIAGAVGRVYSLSYEPKDENRDGGWREVKVTVKGHPELVVLTRGGYYAN